MNYEEIKKLIDDMGTANIDELEIQFPEGTKISMKKNRETMVTQMQPQSQIISNSTGTIPSIQVNNENKIVEQENKCNDNYKIIKSPIVGTFYSKPSPDKDTFVNVGDMIKKGQVVCIVEAMKLMNEIESEFDGKVVEICAKDGDIIEYGMPLFKIL